eukprot:764941-Hanusia_phi.AAC.2
MSLGIIVDGSPKTLFRRLEVSGLERRHSHVDKIFRVDRVIYNCRSARGWWLTGPNTLIIACITCHRVRKLAARILSHCTSLPSCKGSPDCEG